MADSGKRDRGPYKRNRRGGHSHHHKEKNYSKDEGSAADPVEMTPALKIFKACQTELDCKHDKYERLVKLSRDITIESKRVIFLLHRIEGDSEEVLEEAESRLKALQDNMISKIAYELKGEDVHQFLRSFSPGLQEYIEAVAFYLFIKENRLVSMEEVNTRLTFPAEQDTNLSTNDNTQGDVETATAENTETDQNKKNAEPSGQTGSSDQKESLGQTESSGQTETSVSVEQEDKPQGKDNESPPQKQQQISLNLPPLEVMLGLADFTGELMRLCINTVGSGNLERPFQLLPFMQAINQSFQLLGNLAGREMVRKSSVMRQSLKKMENACYVIKVRGSEIPKHMLKDAFISSSEQSSGSRDNDYN